MTVVGIVRERLKFCLSWSNAVFRDILFSVRIFRQRRLVERVYTVVFLVFLVLRQDPQLSLS